MITKSPQTGEIDVAHGRSRFNLHTGHRAVQFFQQQIHLQAGRRAEVKKRYLRVGPLHLLAQLEGNVAFHDVAEQRRIMIQPHRIRSDQMASQPAVADVKLGGLHQALAQVGGPGRQPVDEKQGLQQRQVT